VKHNVTLPIASLLSILLTTFHLTDDILRGGTSPGGFLASVLILVVWVYGTLGLAERRSGYVIVLAGSLLGLSIPAVHLTGAGIGGSSGFFFVWTLLALGVTALFSLILSVQRLWSLHRGRPR
jgi:NO-binding membrane sensor protein with MHYT domain